MWHDDAFLVGTEDTLRALRLAIDVALADGVGICEAFTNDGEGFRVAVVRVDEDTAMRMALPYADEVARTDDADALWPTRLPGVAMALAKHTQSGA